MRTRLVPLLCVAALIVVVSGCAFLMTNTARRSMTRQVITRETTVAVERAAQVSEAVEIAHRRLAAGAALPGGVAAVERGDTAFLEAALSRATSGDTLRRGTITVDGRVVAKSPKDLPAVVVDDDAVHIERIDARDAGVSFSTAIRNAAGIAIARLHEEISLAILVPRLTQPLFGGRDIVSLVTEDGLILVTPSSNAGLEVQAPKVRELVSRGKTGGVRYHSDALGDRIAAAARVPGQQWSVLIDADASEANAPAGALVARLLVGFAAMILLGGALLWTAAAAVLASRRRLEHAHERSKRDATIDPLTGTGNRRAFEERLVSLRESDAPVGIVMIDIDRLKGINDSRGHAAGDRVIRLVSDAIRDAVRADDAVYRIGGDEFAVIADGLSADAAGQLGARIGVRIAAETLEGSGTLRASVGAAAGAGGSVDDLLHQADGVMYAAKRSRISMIPAE